MFLVLFVVLSPCKIYGFHYTVGIFEISQKISARENILLNPFSAGKWLVFYDDVIKTFDALKTKKIHIMYDFSIVSIKYYQILI